MAAIIWVHEKHEVWDGARNDKGDYEFNRGFDVLTETRNVGPFAVLSAQDPVTGLAIPGDFDDYHAGDDAVGIAFVKSKRAKRNAEQPKLWHVEVRYSTDKETQERQQNPNPFLRPPRVRWGSVRYSKVIDVDIEGTQILNTAGEFYDPLPEIDDSRPALFYTRNVADPWNFTRAIQYQDAINTDGFLGFDPFQAKIAEITATKVFENEYIYWEESLEFHFRRETWRLKGVSRGRNELVDGVLKPILDPTTKQPYSDPQPLDSSGAKAETGAIQTFRAYKELAFGPLAISV